MLQKQNNTLDDNSFNCLPAKKTRQISQSQTLEEAIGAKSKQNKDK